MIDYGNITKIKEGTIDLTAIAIASELKAKKCELYNISLNNPKIITQNRLLENLL